MSTRRTQHHMLFIRNFKQYMLKLGDQDSLDYSRSHETDSTHSTHSGHKNKRGYIILVVLFYLKRLHNHKQQHTEKAARRIYENHMLDRISR